MGAEFFVEAILIPILSKKANKYIKNLARKKFQKVMVAVHCPEHSEFTDSCLECYKIRLTVEKGIIKLENDTEDEESEEELELPEVAVSDDDEETADRRRLVTVASHSMLQTH